MQIFYILSGLLYLIKCQLLIDILFNSSTDGNLVSTLIAELNKNFSDQEVTLTYLLITSKTQKIIFGEYLVHSFILFYQK
ncbi:unnamed protein product [Blepharisma stoltei]|uniref:Uncharacterized protein n=1 Tax=Blepharisma stoltei TaxID=1481888 RepID=A0AAU9I964_9CILI|nr:unnamed protein product [Blepharisma stoltei]